MKAKAAVLFEVGKGLKLCEIDVEDPREGQILVRMAAGGNLSQRSTHNDRTPGGTLALCAGS